jgi:hypothetical protein
MEGRMTVKWNNEYNPNELAKKINAIKITDKNGNTSFHAFPYTEYLAVLESMLTFESDVPESDRSKIIRDAVSTTARNGILSSKNLLIEIDKATRRFLSLPINKYVFISSLSINQTGSLLPRQRINGNLITPQPSLNKKYLAGIKHLQELTKFNIDIKPPINYMPIKISVYGRTFYEAFDIGINTLDLLRGIWNLGFNRSQRTRISFGTGEPVNKIRTGPVHSLHLTNGELATDTGWFDPDFRLAKPLDITPHTTPLNRSVANTILKLKKSQYRNELEDAIILYTRALDLQDWNSAFLKLWSLLEKLTDTEGSYSTTIRRASFVFQDKEYYQQVLKHLKNYRNKFVHDAFSSHGIETYMYQLKECTEALLGFHIGNSFGFRSIKEAAEFLDLPTDKKILNKQIAIREHARKYLRHTK